MITIVDTMVYANYDSNVVEIIKSSTFDALLCGLRDRKGVAFVVLLCGGDKSTQDADIKAAKRIAAEWKE